MKSFIFLLIISTSILYPQQQINPDGYVGYLSFHLTPFFTSGEYEINTKSDQPIGTEKISSEVGLNVTIKFPISTNFTLTGFYNYEPNKSEFTGNNNYLSELTNGSKNTYGITLSLYTY